MRYLKEMIVENCKLYYQSEERNRIPDDRTLPLSNNATYGVRTGSKKTTGATISMRSEIPLKFNEWRLIRDVFLTKLEKRRQFNEQCCRDLHRWFRENEPFINDLAKDIVAANRNNFKIFKNGR
nr:MAG TPA: protein of unknown function (DUF4635) [Caudoviricetes sp.]